MFTHYYRHPGLTKSTEENILRKLQTKVDPAIAAVDTELCYNLDMITDFTKEESEVRFVRVPSCPGDALHAQRELQPRRIRQTLLPAAGKPHRSSRGGRSACKHRDRLVHKCRTSFWQS